MPTMEDKDSDQAGSSVRSPVSFDLLVLVSDLVQMFVVGLLLDVLLFSGTEVSGLIRLGVVAAVMIAVIKTQGWLVLLVLQASLFFSEPRRPDMVLGLTPWLYSLSSLCLIAYVYLGKSFRKRMSQWLAMQALFGLGVEEQAPQQSSSPQESPSSWIQFVSIQVLLLLGLTFVAMLALLRLPISSTARSEWFRHAIENDFTVWPGATLLVLTLLLIIVFMETSWRQMTTPQAKLYLRSAFFLEHYKDLRMVVVRRLKNKRKLAGNSQSKKLLVERTADPSPKSL